MKLTDLNPAQQTAASHHQGPLLIIAGAGAGKTKTVTYRILSLIESGVAPEAILAVTFTNKAAKEMTDRVSSLLGEHKQTNTPSPFQATTQPFMSTFHGLGVHILRAHGHLLGISKYFTILDRDDSLSNIKTALKNLGLDAKQFEPRKVLSKISHYKGKGFSLAEYESEALKHPHGQTIANIWREYNSLLVKHKSLDFDDLLVQTVRLFERFPETLQYYQKLWLYLHVDEYQDTNGIQYTLVQMLAASHRNICVVGDVDQSIYSWRGANFENLMRFEEDYPEATVVLLEQNYRSTKTILAAASGIIEKNTNRKAKKLFTDNPDGEPITLMAALDEKEEARFIADTCRTIISRGIPPDDIAVLYRANFQSRAIEEALLKLAIPYQVLGVRFFERKEIKDMLCFAKFTLNRDDLESLKRIINVPPRGIGKVTLAKIATGEVVSLPAKAKISYQEFITTVNQIQQYIAEHTAQEILKYILETSGLESFLKNGTEEDAERLENIRELVTLAEKYNSLPGEEGILSLISEAALVSDQDTLGTARTGIRLMTIHASKGLEFHSVFVTGLEQGLFPHQSFGGDESRDEEEERRLCYVALTRAREKLYLSYAQMRTIFGSRQVNIPSEFLLDIPDQLIEAEVSDDDNIEYLDF